MDPASTADLSLRSTSCFGFRGRQVLKHYLIEDAEDCGIRTDARRQHQNSCGSKPRITPQLSNCIAQILPDLCRSEPIPKSGGVFVR